ncbi:SDR family oxidoreductase [Mesorhizobium sp. LHD-90]|uniref:SDR family NAD(P)-dependent oxidoreductase n=1 Tax=Mesorhizobium sp. LHD-90 TaxID=3071414 RepID=UPI0027DEBBA4|nr:SDR family oxidoreductase [Mesorhizobium sp. LHD-90]MDQ6434843.1 SDR family oxidoreductase [Mesorhizobium sp. LHD-90]
MSGQDVFATWRLDGRTALVTGASSGLGRHFAGLLARAGASVVLAARRTDRLEALRAEITAAGGQASAIALDVTDAGSIASAFDDVVPDILVNNAGIAHAGKAMDMAAEDWEAVIDTNLTGAFLVAQAAARKMAGRGRGGSIVNIASITGFRVANQLAAYAASKAGLVHLTKALALEWARHGIRVNALCPGYIVTEINRDFFTTEVGEALVRRIPQRRIGLEQDLDGALLLLASDAGAYITGAALAVDGGHLVSSL